MTAPLWIIGLSRRNGDHVAIVHMKIKPSLSAHQRYHQSVCDDANTLIGFQLASPAEYRDEQAFDVPTDTTSGGNTSVNTPPAPKTELKLSRVNVRALDSTLTKNTKFLDARRVNVRDYSLGHLSMKYKSFLTRCFRRHTTFQRSFIKTSCRRETEREREREGGNILIAPLMINKAQKACVVCSSSRHKMKH
jgi:hypothetical protein